MIYICAGMYRSGSTWLYNAVRLILAQAGVPGLASGWIGERETLLTRENVVLKIHAFDESLAGMETAVVLTSHRDLRDVLASLHRKFNTGFSLEPLRDAVVSHAKWSKVATFDLRYEDLLVDRVAQIKKIAAVLRLPAVTLAQLEAESISAEVDSQRFCESRATAQCYDAVNLLHEGHITDGRQGSWKDLLPDATVREIEDEFRPWLLARGYLV